MRDPPPGPCRPRRPLGRAVAAPRRRAPARTPPPSSPCSTTPTTPSPRAPSPRWVAWRHALAARRALIESDPDAAADDVAAAREALDKCPPSADTALLMAYLAHVEVPPTTSTPRCCSPSTPACSPRDPRRPALPGAAAGAPLAVAHPLRPRPRGARGRARRCAASTSPPPCREPGDQWRHAAAVGPAAHRAGPDAAPPRRRSTAPASSPPRRSPAPPPRARWTGSPSTPRPTCSTSSRRGP